MRTHAFRVDQPGGPEALKWVAVDLPPPGRGEVLIRHTAIGFNFVDTYMRRGTHHIRAFPTGIGVEGAGVIEAVGRGVAGFRKGDRVAYSSGAAAGSYAEARIRSTRGLVKLPRWLDDRTAAAAISKGMTVQYLFNRTHKLRRGETIVLHAAAGGVGLIACQWAKAVGATVIGTVSTEAKAKLAKRYGCKHPIVVTPETKQRLVDEVMRITKGQGVDVVYDSIGRDLWDTSLACVKRLGLVVAFGFSSGPPPPFDVAGEGSKKSIYVTRATTVNYMTSDAIEQASARALFVMMKKGAIKVRIDQTYPLREAARAHRDAEARRTTGQTVLIP
jgi:NADPH2:quinone reductase